MPMPTQLVRKTSPERADARASLSLRLPATEASTAHVISTVEASLAAISVPETTRLNVQIVLAEALNNVVEHAYAGSPVDTRGQSMVIDMACGGSDVSLVLKDWGNPYPGHNVPPSREPDPAAMAEGGYGWFLIHTLASAMAYTRNGRCNCLRLELPFVSIDGDGGSV